MRYDFTSGEPIFANGAATAAFSIAVQAAASGSLTEGDHSKLAGQCAETGKCHLDDFLPEERRAINRKIEELSTDLMAKPHGTAKKAAIALHNSELNKYANELGLEFTAAIDPDGTITNIGTGFDHYEVNVMARRGQSNWHNHPTGSSINSDDMHVLKDKGISWNFTSGKSLYAADVESWDRISRYKVYEHKDGSWR